MQKKERFLSRTSNLELGLLLALGDVPHHLIKLSLRDDRAVERVLALADGQLGHARDKELDERVVDGLVYEDARTDDARLTARFEETERGPLGGFFEVGTWEDDVGARRRSSGRME